MSGKPGRSGGARPNTDGACPGAGRPPSPKVTLVMTATDDPLIFLQRVMVDNEVDLKIRLAAATALMPYVYSKRSDTGKNEVAQQAAKKASTGRYASAQPPDRLVT